jgi:hypothetical protein
MTTGATTMNQRQLQWAQRYLPAAKRILGEILIQEAPEADDLHSNTDLLIVRADIRRIAVRVRRYGYLERYGNDITIRSSLPSGAETEWDKILRGLGDVFLYAFASPQDDGTFAKWTVLDLGRFRRWVQAYATTHGGLFPGAACQNTDGTWFRSFSVADLPGGVVIARGP